MIDNAHLRPCGAGHGAGFLFIRDLTNKATGLTLIVLIVLYVGSQLASSLMMSSATMDRNQRMIMLFMPLFFVFFVINFPAGVLVYWITTNTWTMAQQFVIKRRIGPTSRRRGRRAAGRGGDQRRPDRAERSQAESAARRRASTEPRATARPAAWRPERIDPRPRQVHARRRRSPPARRDRRPSRRARRRSAPDDDGSVSVDTTRSR